MIYRGYAVLNVSSQQVEAIGLSDNPDDFEPGATKMVPVAKFADTIPTIPPTPPVVRKVLYFSLEYDDVLSANTLFNNHEWINQTKVAFTVEGISELLFSLIEEDYNEYKSRVQG